MPTLSPLIVYERHEVEFDSPFGSLNRVGRLDLFNSDRSARPRNHWVVEHTGSQGQLKVLRFTPFGRPRDCCDLEYGMSLDPSEVAPSLAKAFAEYEAQLGLLREAHIDPLLEATAIGEYTIGHGSPDDLDHPAPKGIFVLQPYVASLDKVKAGSAAEDLTKHRHQTYIRLAKRRGGLVLRDLHHREQYATNQLGDTTILVDPEPLLGKNCSFSGCPDNIPN